MKESISQAWGAIAAAHLLDGLPYPRNPPNKQAHTGLNRRLTCQIKTYDIEDPPVKQEKASPLGIVHFIVDATTNISNSKTRHVSDLAQLGFYF